MRQKLLRQGANELSYEIRGIVKKTEALERLGKKIYLENIGDPVQKKRSLPLWIKEIIRDKLWEDSTYSYSHSKGLLETRQFLAEKNNKLGGVPIEPDDITFFNGLGDAIGKIYQYLTPNARVIGPSPTYSTHSSAEAAHANCNPLTYKLDPEKEWFPDLEDLKNKVQYNEGIVGILVINPDNPTGMVYPRGILEKIVQLAREFNLFLVFDEIYMNIVYNEAETCQLSEVIGDVPGMSLKGISKELPWPGARCGWIEYYNRKIDPDFEKLCATIDNAKMIEVSSTTLPQKVIPIIMGDPRYHHFLKENNDKIGARSRLLTNYLIDLPQIRFNSTNGAFYNTIIFNDGFLKAGQTMEIHDNAAKVLLKSWLSDDMEFDQRFVYYLLAAKGICVVPISAFCSKLLGFRVTMLEESEKDRIEIFTRIREGIIEYCSSN